MWENVDAVWVDVNNDNNPDLVIASGGNEYYGRDAHLLPLIYLNDGKGNLTKKIDAFTDIFTTQSVVAPNDFDGDGKMDLFIGGRAEPWKYGKVPISFLLQNDGSGKFIDVTKQFSIQLQHAGMVTNAQWADINKDGIKDLMLCYQWGGIEAFINNKTSFTKKIISDKKGWWNFILPVDLDNDGDMDFIAGNFGLNSRLKASEKEPVCMYYNDFDNNGKKDQVLTYFLNGEQIPFATKQDLEKQMPMLKKKFLYAEDFAKSSLINLFGENNIKEAVKLSADYFSSTVFINDGNMHFQPIPLPYKAQLSTFRDAVVINANNDNLPDVLMMGNFYENNVEIGNQDADFGTILINKGKGKFETQSLNGITVKDQIRHIRPIHIKGKQAFILAKNNNSPIIIKFK